jgi:bacterioferritin-associated ferredoxin
VYACICHAVPVREVKRAVRAGADSVDAIGRATAAGTGCGSCHETLQGVLERTGCPLAGLLRPSLDGSTLPSPA